MGFHRAASRKPDAGGWRSESIVSIVSNRERRSPSRSASPAYRSRRSGVWRSSSSLYPNGAASGLVRPAGAARPSKGAAGDPLIVHGNVLTPDPGRRCSRARRRGGWLIERGVDSRSSERHDRRRIG